MTLLDEARDEGLFRVVLIHHPPKLVDRRNQWRKLTDGRRFRAAIERCGAELILHGHDHVRMMTAIRGRSGIVPVVGVPSGSGPAQAVCMPAATRCTRSSRTDRATT